MLSFGAFLTAVDMEHRKIVQELPNAARAISAKLLCARYAAVESDRTLGSRLLDRPFDCDLVGYPSGSDQITFNQCDAMLQHELVDFLTINDRDHDLVVAYDALPSS